MNPTHAIELLGGLRVLHADRTVTQFRTQKTGTLLAYLAYFPTRHHAREELVERFWPDSDIDAGRASLRTSLAALRRELEPPGTPENTVLVADRLKVHLNPERVCTDVQRFEGAVRSAAKQSGHRERVEALRCAIACYRGPLLPGVYDDWALQERERLQTLYTSALVELAQALEGIGQAPEAIDALRRVLATDPLREQTHADLMRLYHASGQAEAAVRQYRTLEKLLRDQLGTTPSASTRALLESLRRGPAQSPARPEAAPAPPAPPFAETGPSHSGRLPLHLARFFGREEELARLLELLAPARSLAPRLVTLTGPGGCGKTRLAVEVAQQLTEGYAGAVWFVSLAELTDAGQIPGTIAHALGLLPQAGEDPLEKTAGMLHRRPSLLILDNCEQVADEGAGIVWALLERVPTLTCLTTSRQRLGLGGEREIPVEPLPVPSMAAAPERLAQFASVQLFADRAQAVRPEFRITRENAAAVAALCERLEGIPLALELAAAWSQTLTPAQMLARLAHRFDLLTSHRRDLAPRHRTLRGAVEWSYRLLNPALQRLFTRLSVFHSGFTLEAVEHVCEEPRALEYLGSLRERSLVATQESGDAMRYRLLETLRDFASEQLSPQDRDILCASHLRYFADFAAEANQHLHGPDQQLWHERLAADHDNLRAALDWSRDDPHHATEGLRLAASLHFFWHVRGHAPEGYRRLTELLAQTEGCSPDQEVRERALRGAGELAYALSRVAEARDLFEQGLAISRARGHKAGAAFCLGYLGLIDSDREDPLSAREHLEAALALWEELGDRGGMAHVRKCMGVAALAQGDLGGALEQFEEALRLYRSRGNRRGIDMILGELGGLMLRQGDFERAAILSQEHLELARDLKDRGHMVIALSHLAKASRRIGDFAAARAHCEQALALAREIGDRYRTALLLCDLGVVAMDAGDQDAARSLFRESLELAREVKSTDVAAAALARRGDLARREGDPAARRHYAESLALYRTARQGRDRLRIARCLEGMAGLATEPDRAVRLYGAADRLRQVIAAPLYPEERQRQQQALDALRSVLGDAAFADRFEQGRSAPLDGSIDFALDAS